MNTDLQPLDLDDIKAELAKENRGKKTIALWEAYQVAVEEKTLDEYKEMLRKHEEYMQADIAEKREKAEKRAEKEAAKKDKAEKRKSQGAKDDDGDEVMGGAGESGKKKKSAGGKRKAEAQEPDDTPQQVCQTLPKPSVMHSSALSDAICNISRVQRSSKSRTRTRTRLTKRTRRSSLNLESLQRARKVRRRSRLSLR